jgi:hypothetical protein
MKCSPAVADLDRALLDRLIGFDHISKCSIQPMLSNFLRSRPRCEPAATGGHELAAF